MPDPTETFQDFHFPKAGLEIAMAFGRQPTRPGKGGSYNRTTALGQNVRTYDPATDRDRGGSRSGQSKLIATQVDGLSWVVQHLNTLVAVNNGVVFVQQSASGRIVYLLAVSRGKVKVAAPGSTTWTATQNNTAEEPEVNITGVMQSAQNNQKLYICDGINYVFYNPVTNSVENWVPTAGQLPRDPDFNTARLICTWRGRTVLSGLLKDPQNWFMSRVSNPNDFDYAPNNPSATDAVAGNNSPLGLIGDLVTALIPYTDDVLIFGGDHTIYSMRGDPASGGQIDLVSDITGMAFGEAWCKDPYGNIFFFGNRPSIWVMSASQPPKRISQPIEPLLNAINTGTNIIRLIWNDREQCLHVFVTYSYFPQATVHFTWEYRANAWWTDVFGNTDLNPLAVAAFDGNDADDRQVLLGGWDGYVRKMDQAATTDDGTAIDCEVLIGPILTQELDEMLLKDIQGVLGANSGDVTWSILAGDTAEQASVSAAIATGTFTEGRNLTQPIRVAGHAIYIKLSSTNKWAMESIRTRFAGRGKVRRRS